MSEAGYDIFPENAAAAAGYDSAPGGVWEVPIFDEVYKRIKERIRDVRKRADNGCFIPTTSALGIPGTNYHRRLTIEDLKQSILDAVTYYQPGRGEPTVLTHVQLTPQLIAFIMEHAFGIKGLS